MLSRAPPAAPAGAPPRRPGGSARLSWIAIALLSAGVSALVSIFDKTVIYRYARSPLTLPLIIGIAQTAVGVTLLAVTGIPDAVSAQDAGWALLSGTLFGLSGLLLMHVLYTEEVSRTIPVTQTAPVFAAILALVFLDETLTARQWLAVAATVGGAALLSMRSASGTGSMVLHRSFPLLMLGAAMAGAANVVGKAALEGAPVLVTHALRMLALGLVFLSFNARRPPWRDARGLVIARSPALIFVGVNELLLANVALFLMLRALADGPTALVTALVGTRALLVVLYSTALALVWDGALGEETTRRAIALKLGSAAIIAAGVAAISI